MNLSNQSIESLIDLAINTINLKEMFLLTENPSMNVRRALAKNRNIPIEVVEKLQNDPVVNVSYLASLHPNAKKHLEYNNLRPCVICKKDERGLFCLDCSKVEDHNF